MAMNKQRPERLMSLTAGSEENTVKTCWKVTVHLGEKPMSVRKMTLENRKKLTSEFPN